MRRRRSELRNPEAEIRPEMGILRDKYLPHDVLGMRIGRGLAS